MIHDVIDAILHLVAIQKVCDDTAKAVRCICCHMKPLIHAALRFKKKM